MEQEELEDIGKNEDEEKEYEFDICFDYDQNKNQASLRKTKDLLIIKK